jgi:hypothetical protein
VLGGGDTLGWAEDRHGGTYAQLRWPEDVYLWPSARSSHHKPVGRPTTQTGGKASAEYQAGPPFGDLPLVECPGAAHWDPQGGGATYL